MNARENRKETERRNEQHDNMLMILEVFGCFHFLLLSSKIRPKKLFPLPLSLSVTSYHKWNKTKWTLLVVLISDFILCVCERMDMYTHIFYVSIPFSKSSESIPILCLSNYLPYFLISFLCFCQDSQQLSKRKPSFFWFSFVFICFHLHFH